MGTSAQEADPIRRMMDYYRAGECDSFLMTALRLEKQGTLGPEDHYDARFDCYVRTYALDEAIAWVRSLVRRTHNPRYEIDLAYLYQMTGQTRKAERLLQKQVREAYSSPSVIRFVGNYLMQRGFYDEALELFERGRRRTDDPFCSERARILHHQKQWEASWEAWFECADAQPAARQQWQAFIQDHLLPQKELIPRLKAFLIQKARKGSIAAEDLLAWLYMQEGNFKSALRHYRALDRRLHEQGRRILPLAQAAQEEGFDSIARQAYQYILTLGPQSPHYSTAFLGRLRLDYRRFERPHTPPDSVRAFARTLYAALQNPRYRAHRIELIRMWTNLQAHSLHLPDQALQFLDQQLQFGGLRPDEKGELLLLKGDLLVRTGRLWDGWLAYSRAEKDHKGTIADRARLRKAWLAFYMGNFDYALLFTDVLKGGTDKYVANDAIALELLIKDHRALAPDTSTDLLRRFARAHLAFQQRRYAEALALADSILQLFPPEAMQAAARFLQGQAYEQLGRTDSALAAYEAVYQQHPQSILADDALYRAARLLDYTLHRPDDALPLYERLIFDHSGSIFTAEIRKRYRQLRQRPPRPTTP